MTITAIVILVLLGILLLILEFLVIPGTTIAGIGGIILIAAAVYFGYDVYGTKTGHIILFSTIVTIVLLVIFSLRLGTWNKLMLKSEIKGKVNVIDENQIKVGEIGKTITRLAPIGKAVFGDEEYEVKSNGEFIDHNKNVEILKILSNQLIVKLKTN